MTSLPMIPLIWISVINETFWRRSVWCATSYHRWRTLLYRIVQYVPYCCHRWNTPWRRSDWCVPDCSYRLSELQGRREYYLPYCCHRWSELRWRRWRGRHVVLYSATHIPPGNKQNNTTVKINNRLSTCRKVFYDRFRCTDTVNNLLRWYCTFKALMVYLAPIPGDDTDFSMLYILRSVKNWKVEK